MRRLHAFLDINSANRLRTLLDAAGIQTNMTIEDANSYTGTHAFAVWVPESADNAAINKILTTIDFNATPDTRIDPSDPQRSRCLACNYDLRGQTENGRCPECGHPYTLLTARQCPHCQAENPGDFDLCWQCGKEISPDQSNG